MQYTESAELTRDEFRRIAALLYRHSGITLNDSKEVLVRSRLSKPLRMRGAGTFTSYLDHVENDASGKELRELVDLLTTNKTSFFREPAHFRYLEDVVLPELPEADRSLRIWSAGCSTGEEPYTLAMVLHKALSHQAFQEARILGTDISERVLERARKAEYPVASINDIPLELRQSCVTAVPGKGADVYSVKEGLRRSVQFARLNLMDQWPMKRPFHVIFCRNVMIYFDRETQQRLVQRFWESLIPGGYLFVGHSEGLTSLEHQFRYVRPAVYMK